MLLEVAGCTSSGKSSCLKEFHNLFDSNDLVYVRDHLLRFFPFLKESKKGRELVLDLIYLPYYLFILVRFRRFFVPIVSFIFRRDDTFYMRVNLFRNLIRKISFARLVRLHSQKLIFDEGPVQAIHNALVTFNIKPSEELLGRIEKYLHYVALPNHLLIFSTSKQEFIRRLHTRPDAPWSGKSDISWERMYDNSNCVMTWLKKQLSAPGNVVVSDIINDGTVSEAAKSLKNRLEELDKR